MIVISNKKYLQIIMENNCDREDDSDIDSHLWNIMSPECGGVIIWLLVVTKCGFRNFII